MANCHLAKLIWVFTPSTNWLMGRLTIDKEVQKSSGYFDFFDLQNRQSSTVCHCGTFYNFFGETLATSPAVDSGNFKIDEEVQKSSGYFYFYVFKIDKATAVVQLFVY